MKWPWSKNATDTNQQQAPKGKGITLSLSDKHEPFGAIDIGTIKSILDDEDFTQLQSLYFYMMRDLKISSAVVSRRQPLLGLDFTIKTDNEDFKAWAQEKVNIDELINQLSSGIYYGVSLSDVSYVPMDKRLKPAFKHISPRYLYAHKDKTLKKTIEHLYIKQGDKKLFINKIDPDRVVFHKHAIDIGEITDFSVASKLVWYFSLKHLALAHNMQYFDNVATPPLIAKTAGDEDELISTLYDLKSSSVGVFDKDDIIEYLKVDSKADFLAFIEYIDRQISTFVLGNTLSTGEGKNGSKAQSQTHENRQREVLHFDAKLIAKTITDYLNKLERLNFSNPKGVKFSFNLKQKKDLEKLSTVVKNLSDSGFVLDSEDIQNQFGLKIVGNRNLEAMTSNSDDENNTNSPGTKDNNTIENQSLKISALSKSANNATNKPKPQDVLDSKKPSTKTVENTLVNAIETALEQAQSYEEAYQALLDLYGDMPLEELESALFKAIANSQLLGNAEIENET